MGFQYYINSLADRVRRGVASVKEKAMLEYYEHTRGDGLVPRKGIGSPQAFLIYLLVIQE